MYLPIVTDSLDRLANIQGRSTYDSTLLRVISSQNPVFSAFDSLRDKFVQELVALDDSDDTAEPPQDTSDTVKKWVRHHFGRWAEQSASFVADVLSLVSDAPSAVLTPPAAWANLRTALIAVKGQYTGTHFPKLLALGGESVNNVSLQLLLPLMPLAENVSGALVYADTGSDSGALNTYASYWFGKVYAAAHKLYDIRTGVIKTSGYSGMLQNPVDPSDDYADSNGYAFKGPSLITMYGDFLTDAQTANHPLGSLITAWEAINDLLEAYRAETTGYDDFSSSAAIPTLAGPGIAGLYLRVKFLKDNFGYSAGITASEYTTLSSSAETFLV